MGTTSSSSSDYPNHQQDRMMEPPSIKRLGKNELGRHAFETLMPAKISHIISHEDDSNTSSNVISSLARLLQQNSRETEIVYLCTSTAVQISKLPREGAHFCGYRNIQMLILGLPFDHHREENFSSFAVGTKVKKPLIPELQEMIESAWDGGVNSHGRIQTGGVRGTRKHIGTSEAEAILLHHSIPCTGTAFHGTQAWSQLLDYVEMYFSSSSSSSPKSEENEKKIIIQQTSLPPIFLQRPHHSLTIIGLERLRSSGKRRLLVFDPAWRPPKRIVSQPRAEQDYSKWSAYWTLKRYRRGEKSLRRFTSFETLVVDAMS